MTQSKLETFLAGLDPDRRATVDALRALIAASHDGLEEGFKWNAPSFAHRGEDRITLGLDRAGTIRVVLHRGAKAKDDPGFRFDDPDGLARWPAPDRGVLTFRDRAAVQGQEEALRSLFQRWIKATGRDAP